MSRPRLTYLLNLLYDEDVRRAENAIKFVRLQRPHLQLDLPFDPEAHAWLYRINVNGPSDENDQK